MVGDGIVFVSPDDHWRNAITMLIERDVQAFVVAPVGEAAGLGVAVQDWASEA